MNPVVQLFDDDGDVFSKNFKNNFNILDDKRNIEVYRKK